MYIKEKTNSIFQMKDTHTFNQLKITTKITDNMIAFLIDKLNAVFS